MTRRLITVLIVIGMVATILAGGYAYIQQYLREQEWRRLSVTAEERINARRYDEAIAVLRQIEAAGGTDRTTWQLGRALWEMNQRQHALEAFSRLESRWPDSQYMADVLLYRARYAGEVLLDPEGARELFFQVAERFSQTPQAQTALVEIARSNYERGDVDTARRTLERIIRESRGETRLKAELLLGQINMERLLSPVPSPEDEVYTIQRGDTLLRLANRLRVPMDLLQGINNLDARSLTIGRVIKVPRLSISIVVDRNERTLTILNQERFLKKYMVGIPLDGRRLPPGDYRVTAKTNRGMAYADSLMTVAAGEADNPYGPKIYITLSQDKAIHGTNNPDVVGTYTNRGFISMRNQDAEEVYRLVMTGTLVSVKGEVLPPALAPVSR
jgi:tetratricopeptide (TPR) repeat protein